MNLSRNSVLALQRHFLGALNVPSSTRLDPLPVQPLVFSGDAIRTDDGCCVVNFGVVASPGEERRSVRVGNRHATSIAVRLEEPPAWLMAAWTDADGDSISIAGGGWATLALVVPHDAEQEFTGALRFHLGDRVEELRLRLSTRRMHPIAQIDFNGAPSPHPFDFGMDDGPYVLNVANRTAIPLTATFADLPDWLTFEVDGRSRSGPLEGPFFERTAPFSVQLRPQHLGVHRGILHMRTNDPRPELRNIDLLFVACVVAPRPCVRVTPPPRLRLRADQTGTAEARLENWGRAGARTSKETVPAGLSVRKCPFIPPARDGAPAVLPLAVRVAPWMLVPGAYVLPLSLRIEDGDPAVVTVPVEIEVDPPRRSRIRPELVVALFAILFLTLLFVIVRGIP